MRLIKSIARIPNWVLCVVLVLIGLGIIILAFTNSPLQLQIILGLIGIGFISLGLVEAKQAQNENRDEKRFDQIMAKLDEIQQELQKEPPQENKGIAIADIITSSLKYYTDQMSKPEKEE